MTTHQVIVLMYGIAASGLILTYTGTKLGYRLNPSPSMPYGIWRITTSQEFERGTIVALCLPDGPLARMMLDRRYIKPGECASGGEPLLKPIVALGGDRVSIDADGVSINSKRLPDSAARTVDGAGRNLTPLPPGDYLVPDGAYWAIVPYTWSLDSRYFGALSKDTIIGMAEPIFTWRRTP